MKKLHIVIITIFVISFLIILSPSQTVFGQQKNTTDDGYIHYGPSRQSVPSYLVSSQHNMTVEEQFGNIATTKFVHGDSVLVLNQTAQKLVYNIGENITINTELINIGNKTAEIAYCEPWVALEIKDQIGNEVWPNTQLVCIPEFYGTKILHPGEHISVQPWGVTFAPYSFLQPRLSIPGNYTVMSVAVFTFDMNPKNLGSVQPLWSKPLQITVLPEEYLQNETNSVNQMSSNTTIISNQTIQYIPPVPHLIAPPAPDKIGCYNYTQETGWQSTPCMSQSDVDKLGLSGPPRSSLPSHDADNNSWPSIMGFGSIIVGTTVAISVYVMRIKK